MKEQTEYFKKCLYKKILAVMINLFLIILLFLPTSAFAENNNEINEDKTVDNKKIDNDIKNYEEYSNNNSEESIKDTLCTPQSLEQLPVIGNMQDQDPKPGDYYVSAYSSQTWVLDVAGGSGQNGANVQLYGINCTKAQNEVLNMMKKAMPLLLMGLEKYLTYLVVKHNHLLIFDSTNQTTQLRKNE